MSVSYTIDRLIKDASFEEVDARTRSALDKHGFGVLTEIDVQATMKEKIGKDMEAYHILGACKPDMAWDAIEVAPKVGAMLPCNVILRAVDGGVEVSAVDPVASMGGIPNDDLNHLAGEVREMLEEVIADI